MKSMTGYGFSEKNSENLFLSVELKSYNNRFLEIATNLPPGWGSLEEWMRSQLVASNCRGKIEVYVRIKNYAEELEVVVNEKAVMNAIDALKKILVCAGLTEPICLNHLLRIEGLLKTNVNTYQEQVRSELEVLFNGCLEQFNRSREVEGEKIKHALLRLLADFNKELDKIKGAEPQYRQKIEEYVRQRFQEVLGNLIEENRVLQEIAALFLKSDIHEEVTRIQAHLEAMGELVASNESVGKKLDFICQELNREINTIGSKSFVYEINNCVVNCKELIERMRELLRNVE